MSRKHHSKQHRLAEGSGHFLHYRRMALAVASLGFLACPPLHAAEAEVAAADASGGSEAPALEAVTVRSRARIEKLQDVPLSISVVQGAELSRLDATSIQDVLKRTGNVSWNYGNQRTSSLAIRGIGKVGQTEAQDPSVGVIVDGVSFAYNALTSSFDFVDIDTIEVSRGPQGTLLGKNTTVGNVIFNTRRPSFTTTADYGIAFLQNNTLQAWSAVGGPVVDDTLAWRGTFSVSRGEGASPNLYNRDITTLNLDRVSGRVQFLFRPSADFSAIARVELQPRAGETTNSNSRSFAPPSTYLDGVAYDPYKVSTTAENRLSRRWFTQLGSYGIGNYYNEYNNDYGRPLVTGSRGVSAELNWKLGAHTLTSISAYRDYHFDAVNDEGTPFDIARNSGGYWNDYRQATQEIRLSSPVGGFVDYQGGAFFIRARNSSTYNRIWGNDAGAWYATGDQYTKLDKDAAGRYLMVNSLADLKAATNATAGAQDIDNTSTALFAQSNWHFSERFTLTTGLRLTRENRKNIGSSVIVDNGKAPELNPGSYGGFDITSAGELSGSGVGNTAAQLALADATANKYFGVANYAALTSAQKQQIAAARAIRASQLGVLFGPTTADAYKATQPTITISPSYKFSPDLTGYFSFQHGEKAGIAQFFNSNSAPVKAEKTNNFELGAKSSLPDRKLVLNADIYYARIYDYQSTVRSYDAFTTQNTGVQSYANVAGNVPKLRLYGLEVDGVYAGLTNTTLRFSGAYNRAIYESFPNSGYPVEEGDLVTAKTATKDVSGRTLPGAPLLSFNIGADYRLPVLGDKEFHATLNWAYTSSYLSDVALSTYSRIPAHSTVDAALGLARLNKSFDISLLVKNLFDDRTPQAQTWTSINPTVPRSVGIQILGRL